MNESSRRRAPDGEPGKHEELGGQPETREAAEKFQITLTTEDISEILYVLHSQHHAYEMDFQENENDFSAARMRNIEAIRDKILAALGETPGEWR